MLRFAAVGGIENYTRDMFSALEDRGHTNAVVFAGEDIPGVGRTGRSVYRVPGLLDAADPVASESVSRIVHEVRPEVGFLHTALPGPVARAVIRETATVYFAHNYVAFCPAGALLYQRTNRVCPLSDTPDWRCIANAYVQRCNTRRPAKLRLLYRETAATRRWVNDVQGIVCDSEYVAERHASAGFRRDAIHVLPSPVRIEPEDGDVRAFDPGTRQVVFIGRLVEPKGAHVLIDAMTMVPQPWRLKIVGDGNQRRNLEAQVRRLSLSDRVYFAGAVDREEMPRIYSRAAVVVVPSIWPEPLGMVGPEALLSGCAVVASGIGGISEWLVDGETGLAATPGDAKDLAKKITRVLTDTALRVRLADEGRRRAMTKFAIAPHVDGLIEVFEGAIARQRTGMTMRNG